MAQNKSGTYFYTPDIKVYVWSTVLDKPIELSEDIVDFTINRATNATSTAAFTLANAGFKYTPGRRDNNWNEVTPINTMDRIVVYLKREDYLQVFSGYVTLAPVASLLPEPVTLQAHCTLYKIQNTYWDIGNPAFQALMPGYLMTIQNKADTYYDGGAAQGIVNVLDKVVGWSPDKVHVGSLPSDWVQTALNQSSTDTIDDLLRAIDGGGIVAGRNLIGTQADGKGTGNYVTFSGLEAALIPAVAIPNGAYTYASVPNDLYLNATTKRNGENYSGIAIPNRASEAEARIDVVRVKKSYSKGDDPVSIDNIDSDWWCVIPWPYSMGGFTSDTVRKAKEWLANDGYGGTSGRHIVLTSIANARQVVVQASIAGDTGGQIIISPKAWKYLAGDAPVIGPVEFTSGNQQTTEELGVYATNKIVVTANWARQDTHKGKQNTDTLMNLYDRYGYAIQDTLAQQFNPGNVTVVTSGTKTVGTRPVATTMVSGEVVLHSRQATSVPYTRTDTTSLTTRQWAKQCLYKAGFHVNDWNIDVFLAWMAGETTADTWDFRFNPLNNSLGTSESTQGLTGTRLGSYPDLGAAAQAWADAVNPTDGSATLYPEIRAAFGDKKVYNNTDARNGIVQWAVWGVKNKLRIKYAETRPIPLTNRLPLVTDCSGWVTICYYLAGAPDPNGLNYSGQGYTGTLLTHGRKIPANEVQVGDVVVYTSPGGPATGDHAAVIVNVTGAYANDFLTVSHGGPGYNDPMGYYRVSQDPRIPHYMRYETKKEYLSANRPYNPYHKRPWNSSASDLNDRKRILSQAIVESKWSTTHYGQNPNRFVTASPLEANPTAIAGQGVGAYKGSKSAAGVSVNSTGEPTQPNFNTTFVQPNVDLKTLTLFGTPRAFVTDQPVMGSISTLCASSLREFQSSPTGDFVAWFPDYFGTHGQAPVLNVYDIEIIDFQMYHNDTFLTTHIGVSGDFKNFGSSVDLIDWMSSKGIVSIQVDQVMAQLFGITVEELNALYPPSFSGNFLQRYGMRPKVQEVPIIRSHVTEFMYAWRLFQLCWAAQYSTQVQFTFLPELYPGMRIKIADHNIEVYVQSVTHQGSRQGGFSTTAQVTCPVTRDANGKVKIIHFGFPFKKV